MGSKNTMRKKRRATFYVAKIEGVREFTPVNKRAKRLADKKRTLNYKELRAIKRMGYRVAESPNLRAIKV